MATTYNPITLNDLPSVNSLLSSDKIILFDRQSDGNVLSPKVYSVSDLSAIALTSADVEGLQEKIDAVRSMIDNAIHYLNKNFISKEEAENAYATIDDFNAQLNMLETGASFKNRLSNKGSMDYLDLQYNKVKADVYRSKFKLGADAWTENKAEGRGYKRIVDSKAASPPETE